MTRAEQIQEIAEELTRRDKNTGGYQFGPALRALGEKLLKLRGDPDLDDDVAAFAYKMSVMLQVKNEEKGRAQALDLYPALARIEAQLNKFREMPPPSNIEMRRALIHIANFCMLAERKIP